MRKLLCLILIVNGYVYADGILALDKFLQDKNSTISANFSQTVYGNKKNKVSTGTMEIKRPNKFRWQYNGGGQLIVSDGETIYIYDKPLQQVTEKKFNGSLGKSPALLLAGGSDIKSFYVIKNDQESAGLEWVSLTPKNPDDNNGFQLIKIGFSKKTNLLAQMKLVDSFSNRSEISFSGVKTGIKIPNSEFQFVVVHGVDVIKSDLN
jgi:outer membrane lipoprotein carrier protein